MGETERGIDPQRFLVYIVMAGVILFILEQVMERLTGDSFDQDTLTTWLQDNQTWAWAVILVLWLVQAVIAPLPAPILVMTTAVLYADTTAGIIFTIVLTWVGSMLGAVVCFGLSRHFGRDWVVRKGHLDRMKELDGYLEERGAYVIFLTRLIPILSFDIVSYAAGLTRIRWRDFIAATSIGMLPIASYLLVWLMGDYEGWKKEHAIVGEKTKTLGE